MSKRQWEAGDEVALVPLPGGKGWLALDTPAIDKWGRKELEARPDVTFTIVVEDKK